MLYTRKGDDGKTKLFNSNKGERISKSSCQIESLGSLDELNSFLGLIKINAKNISWKINNKKIIEIVLWIQNCLFTIQAEIAGAHKKIDKKEIEEIEAVTDMIEKKLPPIKTFFISGGSEIAVLFDISRTMTRKAERRVVGGVENGEIKVGANTLIFLNRLSSLLYAYARYSNFKKGINEKSPWYN